jgi:SAM-dependent methyltransferase
MPAPISLASDATRRRPWQLEMFDHSLKKRLKLAALLKQIGNVHGQACLLLTCGDNNGALNWHIRAKGGHWTWGDVAGENLAEMSQFLGEHVHRTPDHRFPFADGQFDCVVSIDVLEHLAEDQSFLRELRRVLRPCGRAVVTVPNGNPRLLANRMKRMVGMQPAVYGHTRAGYTLAELQDAVAGAGLNSVGGGGYSRFFTEAVELLINFGYVYILSRQRGPMRPGSIAPTSSTELRTHGMAYRLFRLAFPMLSLISRMDRLLPSAGNYAVIAVAVKPDVSGQAP